MNKPTKAYRDLPLDVPIALPLNLIEQTWVEVDEIIRQLSEKLDHDAFAETMREIGSYFYDEAC